MSAQVYYYISRYNDEVPHHGPTLEEAARFLHTGVGHDGGGEGEHPYAEDAPLAQPGDIFLLDTLTMLGDVEAQLVTLDDGATVWQFVPPIPEGADFAACRWGEGTGWDADSIFDPRASATSIATMFSDLGVEGDTVEHIAIGRTGQVQARYDLIDDVPVLQLIAPFSNEVIAGG